MSRRTHATIPCLGALCALLLAAPAALAQPPDAALKEEVKQRLGKVEQSLDDWDVGAARRELAEVDDDRAAELLEACGGRVKLALVVELAGVDPAEAEALLEAHGGQVRRAVEAKTGASRL